MPWTRIGVASELFTSVSSIDIYANVQHSSAAGRRNALMQYDFAPLRWTEIAAGADSVLPCDGMVCVLGSEAPGTVSLRLPDGRWETILQQRAGRLYGGAVIARTPSGERFPRIYATDADTDQLLAYQGPVSYRRGLRRTGPVAEMHSWLVIGGPTVKVVEAGPPTASGLNLYSLAPDRQSVWQYSGTGRTWTRIGGPASDLVGGSARPLIAIQPETGIPWSYSGRPMVWVELAYTPDDPPPYLSSPNGRLLVDNNGNVGYLTSAGHLFLRRRFSQFRRNDEMTRWLDLGPASRAAFAQSGDVTLLKQQPDGSLWQWNFPTMALLPIQLPDCVEGQGYGATMRVVGGVPPYAWFIDGAVPNGLRLDDGTSAVPSKPPDVQTSYYPEMNLSGITAVTAHPPPGSRIDTTTAIFPFTVFVTDAVGDGASRATSITWHDIMPESPSRREPTDGALGFVQPEEPLFQNFPAIIVDPPYPQPHELFTISWIGKNYGELAVTGEAQDELSIWDDSGARIVQIYTNDASGEHSEGIPAGQEYSISQPVHDGLPEGRYTVIVDIQHDAPRTRGFNQATIDLPIEPH